MLLDDPDQVREAIRHWMAAGDALDAVERRLIEPAQLSDDEKSGLWLYAWAAAERRHARPLVPAGGAATTPMWRAHGVV